MDAALPRVYSEGRHGGFDEGDRAAVAEATGRIENADEGLPAERKTVFRVLERQELVRRNRSGSPLHLS